MQVHVGLFADNVDTETAGINISYGAEKCELYSAWEKGKIGQKYNREGT